MTSAMRPHKPARPTTSLVGDTEWRVVQTVTVAATAAVLTLLALGPAGPQPTAEERRNVNCYSVQFGGCTFHPEYERTTARG